MHLMIFLKVKSLMDKPPGIFFKSMVALSQGVFANLFFISFVDLSFRAATS